MDMTQSIMGTWLHMLSFQRLKQLRDVKVKHIVLASILLALAVNWFKNRTVDDGFPTDMICYKDYIDGGVIVCRPRCKPGYYSMPWMEECQKYLSCKEIQSPSNQVIKLLGGGYDNGVHQVKWNGYDMAFNTLHELKYKKDFQYGISMLRQFQGSNKVTQLFGYCKHTYVTELHTLGDASTFQNIFQRSHYKYLNTMTTRFKMCISYVEIINYFHNHPTGNYMFCDGSTVRDTLKKFLITPSFTLVANDLDALRKLTKKGEKVSCGHNKPVWGDYVAPEQRWKGGQLHEFDHRVMEGYDEKINIWKIPDICTYFLGNSTESNDIKLHLFKIHDKCKYELPNKRPSSQQVLNAYKRVQKELSLH